MNLDEYTDKLVNIVLDEINSDVFPYYKGECIYLSGPITGVKGYKYLFIFVKNSTRAWCFYNLQSSKADTV